MAIRFKKCVWSLVFAGLILTAAYGYAQPEPGDIAAHQALEEKRRVKIAAMVEKLNLSEEQKRLLKENRNQYQERMRALFQRMRERKQQLQNEIQKGEVNKGKVSQINDELKQIQARLTDLRLDSILEVKKILTVEQFEEFLKSVGGKVGQGGRRGKSGAYGK